MEDNAEPVSTQKKLQSSHDPGWNDPPSWALAAAQKSSSGTPTKRLPNKRVAFPLNYPPAEPLSMTVNPSVPPMPSMPPMVNMPPMPPVGIVPPMPPMASVPPMPPMANVPPMPPMANMPPPMNICSLTTAPHKPTIAPTKIKSEDPVPEIEISKEEALKDTLDNLCQAMEQLNSSKKEEIKKRLDRMEIMWNEDKLNKVVHQKLLEISRALKEGDVEKADQTHISLMMNNASMCSSWMPGIRQIITEMKTKNL